MSDWTEEGLTPPLILIGIWVLFRYENGLVLRALGVGSQVNHFPDLQFFLNWIEYPFEHFDRVCYRIKRGNSDDQANQSFHGLRPITEPVQCKQLHHHFGSHIHMISGIMISPSGSAKILRQGLTPISLNRS